MDRRVLVGALAALAFAAPARAQISPMRYPSAGIAVYEDVTRTGRTTKLRFTDAHFDTSRYFDPTTGLYDGSITVGLNPTNVTLLGDQITAPHLPINTMYFDGVSNAIGGAKTDNYTSLSLTNSATSSTASKIKTGFALASTGTWNGTSAINYALTLTATGGTSNYALWVPNSSGHLAVGTGVQMIFQSETAAKVLLKGEGNGTGYALGADSATSVYLHGGTVKLGDSSGDYLTVASSGLTASQPLSMSSTNLIQLGTRTFAALGTPSDGAIVWCSDCTQANPCAGSSSGAFARRERGAWRCA